MDTLTLDGEIYFSSKHAAKVTGYAKDYVGQLCREGVVDGRLVGRSWYVREQSIREHRFGKDGRASTANGAGDTVATKTVKEINTPEVHYTTEKTTLLPRAEEVVSSVQNVSRSSHAPAQPEKAHHLAAMQQAWQEWFTRAQKPQYGAQEQTTYTDTQEDFTTEESAPEVALFESEKSYSSREDLEMGEYAAPVSVRRVRPVAPIRPKKFTGIRPQGPEHTQETEHSLDRQNPDNDDYERSAELKNEQFTERFTHKNRSVSDWSQVSARFVRYLNIVLMIVALAAFLIVAVNFLYKDGGNSTSFITGTHIYTAK